jgi:hypothetical protein
MNDSHRHEGHCCGGKAPETGAQSGKVTDPVCGMTVDPAVTRIMPSIRARPSIFAVRGVVRNSSPIRKVSGRSPGGACRCARFDLDLPDAS